MIAGERFAALALTLPVLPAVLIWRTAAEAWQLPVIDPDLWWQFWAGGADADGRFPRHNAFSWTAPETLGDSRTDGGAHLRVSGNRRYRLTRGLLATSACAMLLHLPTRPASARATAFAVAWAIPLIVFGDERALSLGQGTIPARDGQARDALPHFRCS